MSNRDLLKEAIADAKTIKETAIANAKVALEEAFAPQLRSMLSAKLEEMEKEDMEEGYDEKMDEALGKLDGIRDTLTKKSSRDAAKDTISNTFDDNEINADDIDFEGFQNLLGKGGQGEVFRVKQRRFTRAAKVVSLRGLTLFRVILGALALAVVTGGCPPGFVGPYQLKHSGPKGRIVRFREYNESPCRPLRLEKLIHGHVHQRVRKKEATCNYSKFANDEDALDIEPYQESMRRSRSGFG